MDGAQLGLSEMTCLDFQLSLFDVRTNARQT